MLSIDLAAIMAGSGIRGQFEEKFKNLLRDIEEEVCHIFTSFLIFLVSFCRVEISFVLLMKFVGRFIFLFRLFVKKFNCSQIPCSILVKLKVASMRGK